jgi:5-bromo-4-chloroindolyl phosphate hydrolysis protein
MENSERERYDDDYNERRDFRRGPTKGVVERILTPGHTTNNVVKTIATGIIAGATILLMIIYAISGDRLVGASYLPLLTALASAISTACIWIFGRPKTEEAYNNEFTILRKELRNINSNFDELQDRHADLEKRLTNVELIESFEDKLAKHTLDKESQTLNPAEKIATPPPIFSTLPSDTMETSDKMSIQQKEPE